MAETTQAVEKKKPNLIAYLKNTKIELSKISWPTRRETIISTIMVFVMATIMAIFLFVADQVIAFVIKLILGLNG